MSELVSILPSTLIGWIATVLATGASVTFIFSRVRQNDMTLLRQTNEDLRAAHNDNTEKIEVLQKQVDELCGKVKVLEKTNKTFEDIITVALKQFFETNPQMAVEMQELVNKE